MKKHTYTACFFSSAWAEKENRYIYALSPDAEAGERALATEALTNPEALACLNRINQMTASRREHGLELLHRTGVTHLPETPTETAERETAEAAARKSKFEARSSAEAAKETLKEKKRELKKSKKERRKIKESEKAQAKIRNSCFGFQSENPSDAQRRNQFLLGTGAVAGAGLTLAVAAPALKGIPVLGATSAGISNVISSSWSGIASYMGSMGGHISSGYATGGVIGAVSSVPAALAGFAAIPVVGAGALWFAGKTMAASIRRENLLKPDSDPDKSATLAKLEEYGFMDHVTLGLSAPAHLTYKALDVVSSLPGEAFAFGTHGVKAAGKTALKIAGGTAKLGGNVVKWGGLIGGGAAITGLITGGAATAATLGFPAAVLGAGYGTYKWLTKK